MRKAIEKNARLLALFAISCTAVVGLVHLVTKDTIVAQEQQQLINTLNSLIPIENHNNDISQSCFFIQDELLGNGQQKAYLAMQDQQPVAAAITATAPDGYNGNIELLVAVNIDGSVSGVRTLKHQETPGLGDKIELRKSRWILSFAGKKIRGETDNRWAVAKDGGMFDQFTGATITPRAVVKAVKQTVDYFNLHKSELFQHQANCQVSK